MIRASFHVYTCLFFYFSAFNHIVTFQTILGNEQLKNSPCSDGKSLADHTALVIGSVGENVILSRALCLSVDGDLKLAGHVHPPSEKTSFPHLGRFAAVVVYKANPHTEITEKVGKQLCQHIIGLYFFPSK